MDFHWSESSSCKWLTKKVAIDRLMNYDLERKIKSPGQLMKKNDVERWTKVTQQEIAPVLFIFKNLNKMKALEQK